MGNFKAQGEEENMFWVTTNDGFDAEGKSEMGNVKSTSHFSLLTSHTNSDSLELYNSMELTPLATVENDLIGWGKWDWGNTCLLNEVDNLTMQNGIFRNGSCGFYSTNVDVTNCSNILGGNCWGESDSGIYFVNIIDGFISKCQIYNSGVGIKIENQFTGSVDNNYLSKNKVGIRIAWFKGVVKYNDLVRNLFDISFSGCPDSEGNIIIEYNNFISIRAIEHVHFANENYQTYPPVLINNNNFYCDVYFLAYFYDLVDVYGIDFTFNFFYNIVNEEELLNKIIDKREDNLYQNLVYIPWYNYEVQAAGIQ
jgi:hypothetical protein